MSEPIDAGSKWVHRKTDRPIKVTSGTYHRPEIVMGVLFDKPSETVHYEYTDRTSRVMPMTMKVERFLKTFAKAKP